MSDQPQQPQPLQLANPFQPCSIMLGEAKGPNGDGILILRIESANGSFMFGLGDEQAVTIGQKMVEMGESRQHNGLTVVRSKAKPSATFEGPKA